MTPSPDQFSQMLSWILLFLHDLKDLPLRRNASAALSSGPQLSIAWITMTAPWLISWILQSLWKLYNISCSKLSSGSQISLEPNQNLLNITYKIPCGLALDDLSSLMSLPALPASLITVQLSKELSVPSSLDLCTGCSLCQESSLHHLSLHVEKPHLTSPGAPSLTPQHRV